MKYFVVYGRGRYITKAAEQESDLVPDSFDFKVVHTEDTFEDAEALATSLNLVYKGKIDMPVDEEEYEFAY
jgi:hypothetical protein